MRGVAIVLCSLALVACDSEPSTAPEPTTSNVVAPVAGLGDFQPLQSDAVKDAIHSALKTGESQRWQDGAWSGYAVPSAATNAQGCRSIRYTVDQRPEVPFESITACEAN